MKIKDILIDDILFLLKTVDYRNAGRIAELFHDASDTQELMHARDEAAWALTWPTEVSEDLYIGDARASFNIFEQAEKEAYQWHAKHIIRIRVGGLTEHVVGQYLYLPHGGLLLKKCPEEFSVYRWNRVNNESVLQPRQRPSTILDIDLSLLETNVS